MKIFAASLCVLAALMTLRADDLSVAKEALRDGLWSIARAHASKVPGDEAKRIVLESFACENRWGDIKNELAHMGESSTNVVFAYYRAVCDERYDDAAKLLRENGSVVGLAESRMLEADFRVKRADLTEARRLWGEVLQMTNVNARAYAYASLNLGDVKAMRAAYSMNLTQPLRRLVGLRLGVALLGASESATEGEKLIRMISHDAPDTEGAREAFLALAESYLAANRWKDAVRTYVETIEIWPDAARLADVYAGRGEALGKLGRYDEALENFSRAEMLSTDDAHRALAVLKQGDIYSDRGKNDEALRCYRSIIDRFPNTTTAVSLKRLVDLREREMAGRELYREYRFDEARKVFAEIAVADPERRARMDYLEVLCLFGLGRDDSAQEKARVLSETCEDVAVAAEAKLWLAKFAFNRADWKLAVARFVDFVDLVPTSAYASTALLWASRAAFSENDYQLAIELVTRLQEQAASSPEAASGLIIQARALIEQSRYDEAVLVLERVAMMESVSASDRLQARLVKADALFAMGTDNPARYQAALEAYRAVTFDAADARLKLSVAFKIARSLEKLKRVEEAIDCYYTRVVLAYREGRMKGERFDDESRAYFSRAALWLADEFESRGRTLQAASVLKLIVESDVPASSEAADRIHRIMQKGDFL